jgi:hypothetical protein
MILQFVFVNVINRLVFTLFGVACFCVVSCYGQEITNYTNFADYLTNRTWIQEIEMDLSKNRYQPANRPSNAYHGFTTWKASLQPNGFFVECVSNSPYHASTLIYGESSSGYWQTSYGQKSGHEGFRGAFVAPKKSQDGGSTLNTRQIAALHMKMMLLNVLNIGIEGLDSTNIRWLSETVFTSPALDGAGQLTSDKIQVTIESFDRGLPSRLHYIRTGDDKLDYLIFCKYDHPVLPPSEKL